MAKIKRFMYYLLHSRYELFVYLLERYGSLVPDALYIKILFKYYTGKTLNLNRPQGFCEKIQWLKLYDRNPLYVKMVDKNAVKQYVASIIGQNYIIPTIATFDDTKSIDWDMLPNKFVIKCTHDSGGVIICKNKKEFNQKEAVYKLDKCLKYNYYNKSREWPYKHVKPQIIVEKFMESNDDNEELSDYKFFCFDGEPLYCQVIRNRNTKETIDFYDMDWNHQEFIGLNPHVSNGLKPVKCPQMLDEMITICKKLAEGIPFIRVDLYVINGNTFFGELTFYPASGMGKFSPEEYDFILGEKLNIYIR